MLKILLFVLKFGMLYCFVRHRRSPRGHGVFLNFELEEPIHVLEEYLQTGHAKRGIDDLRPGEPTNTSSCCNVRGVPEELRSAENMKPNGLDMFYQKYTEAYGIPIIASENVTDDALRRACYVARFMLADHSEARRYVYKLSGRIGIIGVDEETTTIPEHSHMDSEYWDARARGLGGTPSNPISTAGEENMLCGDDKRYPSQDILVHEFAHGVHLLGAVFAMGDWDTRLKSHFDQTKEKGKIWVDTYAMTNKNEYFAEATQHFFKVKKNPINLEDYDPKMFALISEVFPCKNIIIDRCRAQTCEDENENCEYWARIDECTKNPGYMLAKCRKSCNECSIADNISTLELRHMELEQDLTMNCNPPAIDVIDNNWCHSDTTLSCKSWSNGGECEKNPGYMLANCKASCPQCKCPPQGSTCVDKHDSCCLWAYRGECDLNPGYMHANCPLSCDTCPPE